MRVLLCPEHSFLLSAVHKFCFPAAVAFNVPGELQGEGLLQAGVCRPLCAVGAQIIPKSQVAQDIFCILPGKNMYLVGALIAALA